MPSTLENIVTRIAPTPSGFLHRGNLLNFLLVQYLKEMTGAKIILRIDDLDAGRCRDEYLEDIFKHLDWLGIQIDEGPSGVEDFKKFYSQKLFASEYQLALEKLKNAGAPLYHCRCSRKDVEQSSSHGRYPRTCLPLNLNSFHSKIIRINTQGCSQLEDTMGDFIIWKREDVCAYQLASLVDDLRLGVNFIIRGSDLEDSTRAQNYLKSFLAPKRDIHFYHHPLITHH